MIMKLCFLPAWATTGLSSAVRDVNLLQVRTWLLQGTATGPALQGYRWQGKQPLSYHGRWGVLRQMEAWWGRESTCNRERSRHWDIRERRWDGSWVGFLEGRGGKLGEEQTSREISRSV